MSEPCKGWWYKAHGMSTGDNHKCWQGCVEADTESAAMAVTRQRSLIWNAREIYSIAIHEIDDDGLISEQPVIWASFTDKELEEDEIPWNRLPPLEKKENVREHYEAADWLRNSNIPARFDTVTLKETI